MDFIKFDHYYFSLQTETLEHGNVSSEVQIPRKSWGYFYERAGRAAQLVKECRPNAIRLVISVED